MNSDGTAFLAEIDARIEAHLQDIRDQAEGIKADLASGVLALRAKAEPTGDPLGLDDDDGSMLTAGMIPDLPGEDAPVDLGQFGGAADGNGAHPLDAPIFGESDSFLNDDLDFSIDLDDKPPA
jgi:hypothetical protein